MIASQPFQVRAERSRFEAETPTEWHRAAELHLRCFGPARNTNAGILLRKYDILVPTIPSPRRNGGAPVAAPEDDQYTEHHCGTIVFSSFRVPQGGISDCWRIRIGGRSPRTWVRWGL